MLEEKEEASTVVRNCEDISKSDFHKYSSKFLKGRSAGFKMNRYLLLPDESGDEGGPCARL